MSASAFAELRKLSNYKVTSTLPLTAFMEQIPIICGRDWKERYPDLQHRDASKMDPVIYDRCVKTSPD